RSSGREQGEGDDDPIKTRGMRFSARRLVPAAALLVIVVSALWAAPGTPGKAALSPTRPSAASGPSIVLILTDDQRFDTLWAMPTVQREIVRDGVEFRNAYVVNPLCCP